MGRTWIADGLDCRLLDRLGSSRIATKTRKNGGRGGLSPWPFRCLSQFLPERKERLLRAGGGGGGGGGGGRECVAYACV